jgi:hypothetical protein
MSTLNTFHLLMLLDFYFQLCIIIHESKSHNEIVIIIVQITNHISHICHTSYMGLWDDIPLRNITGQLET